MTIHFHGFYNGKIGLLRFDELLGFVVGERPQWCEWFVRVVGWHRCARQPGCGFNIASLVEAGA